MDVQQLEGALRLRGWSLDLLLGRPPSVDPPPPASAAVWDIFLRRERCASEILATMPRAVRDRLPEPVREVVVRNATRQTQRVLAARGQLRRIGALLEDHGLSATVLKGGLALAQGAPHGDVIDVDLLVRPADVNEVMDLLQGSGYEVRDGSMGVMHHEPPISLPNLIPVEIHTGLQGFSPQDVERISGTTRSLPGLPGIEGMEPAAHLSYLLDHSSLRHPHRLGCIRELLLLRRALEDCSAAERSAVREELARHPDGRVLEPWLAFAEAARDGSPDGDPFQRVAAAHYLMLSLLARRGLPRAVVLPLARQTLHVLGEGPDEGPWQGALHDLPVLRSDLRGEPGLTSAALRRILVALRRSRFTVLLPGAWLLARRVRRAVPSPQ